MTTPADLQRVADWHAKCAAVAEAKVAQYEHQGEAKTAATYRSRAEGHRMYQGICEGAAKALTTRERRGVFVPPSFSAVRAYAKDLGWPEDNARGWFDHFESNGWRVSGKSAMVDWMAAARNGFRRWQREHGKAPQPSANDDPAGWPEYLTAHPEQKQQCRHAQYRYAPERVQRAFLTTRK